MFSSITTRNCRIGLYEIVGRGFKWPCLWSGLRPPDNVCKRTGLRVRSWRRLFLLRTPSRTDCGNADAEDFVDSLLDLMNSEQANLVVSRVSLVSLVSCSGTHSVGYLPFPKAMHSVMRSIRSFSYVSPFLISEDSASDAELKFLHSWFHWLAIATLLWGWSARFIQQRLPWGCAAGLNLEEQLHQAHFRLPTLLWPALCWESTYWRSLLARSCTQHEGSGLSEAWTGTLWTCAAKLFNFL